MLLLLFQVDEAIYAIESLQIIEVLPLILLRRLYQAPKYIVGVFNYRNCIVPVIDLCLLIQGKPAQPRYSTRIIIVQYQRNNGNSAYLGLLAERVTETLECSMQPTQPESSSYLGEIFMNEEGMIQYFHWKALLADIQDVTMIAGTIN